MFPQHNSFNVIFLSLIAAIFSLSSGCSQSLKSTEETNITSDAKNAVIPNDPSMDKKNSVESMTKDRPSSAYEQLGLDVLESKIGDETEDSSSTLETKKESAIQRKKNFASNIPAYRKPTRWIKTTDLPFESWEVHYAGNQAIGFMHQQITSATGANAGIYRIESNSKVHFSGKQSIDQNLKIVSVEEVDGRVKSIETQMQRGDNKLSIEGNLVMGMMRFNIVQNGHASTKQLPWSQEFNGPFAVQQSLRGVPMKEGEVRKLSLLDPLLAEIVEVTLEAGKYVNTPTLDGEQVSLLEVRTTSQTERSMVECLQWVDSLGVVKKSFIGSANIQSFETIPSLAESVRDSFQLSATTVPKIELISPLALNEKDKVQKLLVKNQDQDPYKMIPESNYQSVRWLDSITSELTILNQSNETNTASIDPEDATIADEFTQPSPVLQSDDELVIKIADAALKDSRLGETAQEKLRNGIHKYLQKKLPFSSYIASAAEVARQREGSPLAHAMLLAACARSQSLPSRVSFGVLYNANQSQPAFEFHAWTEVFADSRWTSLDSFLPEPRSQSIYIKFLDSSLSDHNVYRIVLNIFNIIEKTTLTPD